MMSIAVFIFHRQRDLHMLDFYEQLKRFLMNHAPDLDSLSEE